MSEITGKVGKLELSWQGYPRGSSGQAKVIGPDGKLLFVSWKRDSQGLWIELPHGTYGFDISGETGDDGRIKYAVRRRLGEGQWADLAFLRAGEQSLVEAGAGTKKGTRVRAQMPGKIIRVMVKPGEEVVKNQPLLVMEAMKMENEIRAAQPGRVGQVKVSEGQAVETGADLCLIDPL